MGSLRYTTPDLEAVGPIPVINQIAEVTGTGTPLQQRTLVASPGKLNVVAKPDGRKWFEFKGLTYLCLAYGAPAVQVSVPADTPQGVNTPYNCVGFRLLVESMAQLGVIVISNAHLIVYGSTGGSQQDTSLPDFNLSQFITEPGEYYIEIRTFMVTYATTGTVSPYMVAQVWIDGVNVQSQSAAVQAPTVKANYMYWPLIRQAVAAGGLVIRDVYAAMALVGEENKIYKSMRLKAAPYRASAVSGYDNLPASVTAELANGFKETTSRIVGVNSTPTKLVGNGGYVDLVADFNGDRLVGNPMLAIQFSRLDGVNTKVVVSTKLDDSALFTSSSTTAGAKGGALNHITDALVRPADTYRAIRVTYTPLS